MSLARALLGGCLALLSLFGPSPAAAQIDGSSAFLVAAAKMNDPRFAKTVVLVTRHGRSPPLGVIINRPLRLKLSEVLPNASLPDTRERGHDVPLFFGGPVARSFLVYLFRSDDGGVPPSDAIQVAPDIHLGRGAGSLNELLNGKRAHRGLRVFAGYAGWAPGQLEKEIARGDWHLQTVDRDYLFDKDVELIWPELHRRATQTMAGDRSPRLPAPAPAFHFPSLI